jgi:hypothetical protein
MRQRKNPYSSLPPAKWQRRGDQRDMCANVAISLGQPRGGWREPKTPDSWKMMLRRKKGTPSTQGPCPLPLVLCCSRHFGLDLGQDVNQDDQIWQVWWY